MNTEEIKRLALCLDTLRSAHFSMKYDRIIFETSYTDYEGKKTIETPSFSNSYKSIFKELNNAIKPVIDKYTEIYVNELKEHLDK